MRAARAAAPNARSYATPDGYRVSVEASSSYPTDPAADQQLVDFLASRVHGPELGDLSVYVGTPAEISSSAAAIPRSSPATRSTRQRMYVPGESVRGIPIEYPLTHEYGHHVALWRSEQPPGTRWTGAPSTGRARCDVCKQVQRHVLFPGNQGAHYWDDPGEGFADSYAHLHYPQAPWSYNDLMRPTRRTLAALQRDVLHPWSGPRYPYLPRPGRAAPPHAHLPHPLRLDGDLTMRLAAPRGSVYDVQAEIPDFAAGRRLHGGGAFGVQWCRHRRVDRVKLTVHRRAGSGPFALRVSWPG